MNIEEREVVKIELKGLRGNQVVTVEAFVVDTISQMDNEHVEQIKLEFHHLRKLWFADASRLEDKLCVGILVGIDYIWSLVEEQTIRGEPGEPVAVKTKLGWVLSGPLKGKKLNSVQSVNVNLSLQPQSNVLISTGNKQLDEEVQ